jgi:hypothetical protein
MCFRIAIAWASLIIAIKVRNMLHTFLGVTATAGQELIG